jgi:enolase
VQAFPEGGVEGAIEKFKERVVNNLIGYDAREQYEIDKALHELDGTDNFSNIGGNPAVALSLAVAKAAASAAGVPLFQYLGGVFVSDLPYPLGNVLGGGKHAIGGTDIQEYLVIAKGPSIADSVFANAKVHAYLKQILKRRFADSAIGKGDEGAWVAQLGNEEAVEILAEVCAKVSDELGFSLQPAMDLAASEFYDKGKYKYKEMELDTDGQIAFIAEIVDKYGIALVEDPLREDDFEAYAELTSQIGDRCIVVGDDLFVTNKQRLERGIRVGAANAILVKPNQIGTLTDTYDTVKLAHAHGYKSIMSHRSGETTDDTIAHLAVAFGCYAIKTGVVGGERIAKLNELIRIEEMLKGEV